MRQNGVCFSLHLQVCPLSDAKAMLLIGDDQAELAVFNIFAYQGMCTEEYVTLMFFQFFQDLLSF